MNSAVVILTIVYSVMQSKKTFHQQTALAQIGFVPCLYISTATNTNKIILSSNIIISDTHRQAFILECVSEHPAFDVNWFSWTNASKPYVYAEYEKAKKKMPTQSLTAVKGKTHEIVIELDTNHIKQVLVAEFKDINRIVYVQTFDLEWNKSSNMFDVTMIDSPTPVALNEQKNTK